MALSTRIPITHGQLFPHGCYLVSEVEPVRDFDKSTKDMPVQALDKESGQRVFECTVLDADPDARKTDKTVKVKISADVQPIPPAAVPGVPFTPVEFEGLTITAYIVDGTRPRVGWSYRATSMKAPAMQHRSDKAA